jgi:RES domain-containing protein
LSVTLWRIATDTPDYTADDLSGEGARRAGGRWNRSGTPMLYTAASIALACLETIVHLGGDDLPLNRYLVRIDVPDKLWAAARRFDAAARVGWDAVPYGKVSLDAGEAWANSRGSALFVIPSVIVPEETDVLINPLHRDAAHIRARKMRRWTYDARLKK